MPWFWFYSGLRLAELFNWYVIGLDVVLGHSIKNRSVILCFIPRARSVVKAFFVGLVK